MWKTTAWMQVALAAATIVLAGCQKPAAAPVTEAPAQEALTPAFEEPASEVAPVEPRPAVVTPAPPVDTGAQAAQASPAPAQTPQPKESYASAPPSTSRRVYVVRKNDTLQKIAHKYYGTTRHWRRIYEANRKVLTKGPDKLQVGMRLVIP